MAFLDDVKTRIESLNIVGYTVHCGYMPATGNVIVAYEYGGNPPEFGFGQAGLKYKHPGLNIKVRGDVKDYAGPRAVIEQVMNDLATVQVTTLGSTAIHMMKPTGSPALFERDGNERCTFNVNFIVDTVV